MLLFIDIISMRFEGHLNFSGSVRLHLLFRETLISKKRFEDYLEEASSGFFIPDYLSLRFLSRFAGVRTKDVLSVLVGLYNLLNSARKDLVDEIYLGAFKVKRRGSYFVIEI